MKNKIIIIIVILAVIGVWFIKNGEIREKNVEIIVRESSRGEIETGHLPKLYADNLELNELKEYSLPIMLHMGASWCQPCKEMKPYLEELYEEYKGKILIVYIDVDTVDTEGYPLTVVPTQFFYNSDGTPFIPSEEIYEKSPHTWIPYDDKETGERIFVTHQGLLSKEQLEVIFKEMQGE